MSSGTKKVLFIAYLNVFQSVMFNILKQGKNIRGIVLDVDCKARFCANKPGKLDEFGYCEAVRGVAIPMPIIGLTLEATACHVPGHVFRRINHRAAITEEGKVLLPESLCDVRTERVRVGAEQHLIDPDATLFCELQHEPSLRIAVVGSHLDVETLPVLRDTVYLLASVLLASVCRLQGNFHPTRPFQIHRSLKFHVLIEAYSPAIEAHVIDASALAATYLLRISAGKRLGRIVVEGSFAECHPHARHVGAVAFERHILPCNLEVSESSRAAIGAQAYVT